MNICSLMEYARKDIRNELILFIFTDGIVCKNKRDSQGWTT